MCGIAGIFSQQPMPREELSRSVQAMADSIRHRGPESDGLYLSTEGHAGLGFRRLAFLDLSVAGNQPMYDASGRYTILFNGEAYNFRSLREKLQARGVVFRSTGDCEVVLYLLIHEGVEALAQLRGMFALAFWDNETQSLLLARDRFGIKPVVYAEQAGKVTFASEIRALEVANSASRKIDPAAFYWYLLWGTIASPATWLSGVKSLLPGHYRRYQVGKEVVSGCFADPRSIYVEQPGLQLKNEEQLRQQIGPAVEESVKHHLESDVPVGVFLSGGIDSSAMVSAVRQVSTNRVKTYTITFTEDKFSEESIAKEVAERFETDHQVCRVTAQDFLKDWPTIFSYLDQPTNDGFNSYYVSKVVAEAGQKVVLSGTGGDEFFGGYPSFRLLPQFQAQQFWLRWLGPLLSPMQKPHRKAKWKHLYQHAGQMEQSYRTLRGLFMPAEADVLLGPAFHDQAKAIKEQVIPWEASHLSALGREQPLASVSRLETKQYLGAQLLRDIDVMSMAHSIEVRVPFIDHVLAETLWPSLGHQPQLMKNKRLLYETLKRPLPEAVYQRPKQGFTFPMERWVRTELNPMVREGMDYLAKSGWIAPQVPGQLATAIQEGTIHWSRPWSLAVFGQMAQSRGLT
ncbi:MAG: asparagine synthase (glutamine-hydrolyzing) [Gemmatales bacterium]